MPRNTNRADMDVTTQKGQKPFAVILTCADSRVPPEIYFDQKIGDLFVIRNAGNVADQSVLGSIEYAVEHLKSAIVVVAGHTKCGAVCASYGGGKDFPTNLQAVLDGIRSNISDSSDAEQGVLDNIKSQVAMIQNNPVVKESGVPVIGVQMDIATGRVNFDI